MTSIMAPSIRKIRRLPIGVSTVRPIVGGHEFEIRFEVPIDVGAGALAPPCPELNLRVRKFAGDWTLMQ